MFSYTCATGSKTHLQHLIRNRYYDPHTGRFAGVDLWHLKTRAQLYAYALNNPISNLDPSGLDTVGCDNVPKVIENDCTLECCAMHDKCYDDHKCTSSSWTSPGSQCDPEGCSQCNTVAVGCFLVCRSRNGRGFGLPKFYCAKQHKFVTIPGDFPDRASAESACEYDHWKDCCKLPKK